MSFNNSKIDFNVDFQDKQLFSRSCNLKINGKSIKTPLLWLGHPMGYPPKPWEHFHMDTVMVNAYDFINKPSLYEKVCKKGIHKLLGFEGLIMMDSGGFIFQKKEKIDIEPSKIIELYEKSKPDIGVVLDHPLSPEASDSNNQKRWNNTLKNTDFMIKNNGKIALMPVLHGYSLKELKIACDQIKNINEDPMLIGLGSLVPLLFTMKGSNRFKDPRNYVIDATRLVREEFPNSLLHTFGVGSTKTMHLMYSLGVDSLDSSGWRLKAAYGNIQLPGVSDRHPTSRNNGRSSLNEKEKKILEQCECPTCYNKSLQDKIKSLDGPFPPRALHNAWVHVQERESYIKSLNEGKSKEFTEKRLKGFFSKSYEYLINIKEIKTLDRW
jgi:tRNA-guanine family transglycosylase